MAVRDVCGRRGDCLYPLYLCDVEWLYFFLRDVRYFYGVVQFVMVVMVANPKDNTSKLKGSWKLTGYLVISDQSSVHFLSSRKQSL